MNWAQLCFTFHLAMCEGLCSAGFSTYPNSESFDDPYGRIEHICASCILNTSIWQDGYEKETFECSICYFVSLIIEIFQGKGGAKQPDLEGGAKQPDLAATLSGGWLRVLN